MNYLLQIKAFYDWLVTNPIPADAQALWHALMFINNKCGWAEWFTVSNTTLISMLNFSRQQLHNMREILVKNGLILYKKSSGRKAGHYCITGLVSNNFTQVETQPETQVETQDWHNCGHNHRHNHSTLNKQNKTKQNKTENTPPTPPKKQSRKKQKDKPPKIHYAEYVTMTETEYQTLISRFGEADTKRMIEILNAYKGSTGKTYESDYMTMYSWVYKRLEEEKRRAPNIPPGSQQIPRAYAGLMQMREELERREREGST